MGPERRQHTHRGVTVRGRGGSNRAERGILGGFRPRFPSVFAHACFSRLLRVCGSVEEFHAHPRIIGRVLAGMCSEHALQGVDGEDLLPVPVGEPAVPVGGVRVGHAKAKGGECDRVRQFLHAIPEDAGMVAVTCRDMLPPVFCQIIGAGEGDDGLAGEWCEAMVGGVDAHGVCRVEVMPLGVGFDGQVLEAEKPDVVHTVNSAGEDGQTDRLTVQGEGLLSPCALDVWADVVEHGFDACRPVDRRAVFGLDAGEPGAVHIALEMMMFTDPAH